MITQWNENEALQGLSVLENTLREAEQSQLT